MAIEQQVYKVIVDKQGTFWYNEKDQLHRINGPACEWATGSKWWEINGRLHREDGPAIEFADGTKFWYLNGKEYFETEFNQIMDKKNRPCLGKTVTVDGVEYQLV